jgi:hypothetical protein
VAPVNTHHHLDHTHGNPGFPIGTKVVSTDRTLDHLRRLDAVLALDFDAVVPGHPAGATAS